MPLIDVTYPEGALTPEQRTELADELTTVLLRAERAPDTEFFRTVTWVYVHELPAGTVLSAGQPVEEPIFKVDVTTPEGALSDRRRKELVAEATRVVLETAGLGEDQALRVWVHCHEIAEGSWGTAGHVVEYQALVAAAKHERERAGDAVATGGLPRDMAAAALGRRRGDLSAYSAALAMATYTVSALLTARALRAFGAFVPHAETNAPNL